MLKKSIQTKLTKSAKNEAEKILKGLLEVCQIYHTPMFATIVVDNSDSETIYNNIVYSAQSHQERLYDDKILKHMLVANGFECIPPDETAEKKAAFDEYAAYGITERRFSSYALDDIQMKELQVHIKQIADFSEKYNTSVFADIAVANHDGVTEYISCCKRPDCQISLKKDEIRKHISISEKGFCAVVPRETAFVDMEEVFGEYVEF